MLLCPIIVLCSNGHSRDRVPSTRTDTKRSLRLCHPNTPRAEDPRFTYIPSSISILRASLLAPPYLHSFVCFLYISLIQAAARNRNCCSFPHSTAWKHSSPISGYNDIIPLKVWSSAMYSPPQGSACGNHQSACSEPLNGLAIVTPPSFQPPRSAPSLATAPAIPGRRAYVHTRSATNDASTSTLSRTFPPPRSTRTRE